MIRARLGCAAAAALVLGAHGAAAQGGAVRGAAPPARVQAGVAVHPDTVTVGEHFTAVVRVRVPDGVRVLFPARPDTGAHVDTAAPVVRHDSAAPGVTDATASYVLAAWDTGRVALGLDSVIVASGGATRLVPVGGGVSVRSVLPRDTALRVPKPPRPPIAVGRTDWRPWLAALLAAAVAGLAWVAWRRWRRRAATPLAAGAWAAREFARVRSAGWLEHGEADRFAVAMADVLRGYLVRAWPALRPSSTTRELGEALVHVPAVASDPVLDLLERVDLVKFAAAHVGAEEARAIGDAAEQRVADAEAARAAEAARVAAAATARERAA